MATAQLKIAHRNLQLDDTVVISSRMDFKCVRDYGVKIVRYTGVKISTVTDLAGINAENPRTNPAHNPIEAYSNASRLTLKHFKLPDKSRYFPDARRKCFPLTP